MIDPTIKMMLDLKYAQARNHAFITTLHHIEAELVQGFSDQTANELIASIARKLKLMNDWVADLELEHTLRMERAHLESEMEGVIDDTRKQADYLTDEHYGR